MPTRTESICYLDVPIRAERLEAYLEKARPKLGANVTVDDVAENIEAISNLQDAVPMNAGGDVVAKIFG